MTSEKFLFWLNLVVIPICFWGMCQNTDEQWWFTAHFIIAIISMPVLAHIYDDGDRRKGRRRGRK